MAESDIQTSLFADQLLNIAHDAAMDGIDVAAKAVLELGKRNIPVGDPLEDPDPAVALAESGGTLDHESGVIVFFDAIYAAKQHEDLRLRHPRSGGPKYLERALQEVAPSLEGIVASKVDARTATGLLSGGGRSHHKGG